MLTPYQFASNRPIDGVDIDGQEVDLSFIKINLWQHSSEDSWIETSAKVVGNGALRTYNGLVDAGELGTNYQLNPVGTSAQVAVGLGQTAAKVVDYAEKTTPEAFVDDVQAAAQKPETYEQIVSLAAPGAVAKLVKVAQGSKLAATVGRMGKAGKATPKLKTPEVPCTNCGKAGAGVCFVAGTLILTENGLIPIELIEEGDKVWAYSDSLHIKDKKVVLQTIIRNATQITTIVAGTDTIRCTPEHPFYVSNTWVEAGNLVVGDSVFLFDGAYLAIDAIWTRDTSCLVYNFEVDGFHTYFVAESGVLVHNADCFPLVKKAVNSNINHAAERGVERGIFESMEDATKQLKELSDSITKNKKFPEGSILDRAHADRVLVPIGEKGLVSYQVAKNGTAKIKTVLIAE